MRNALVAILTLAAAFAGCSGADDADDPPVEPVDSGPSPKVFDILPPEEVLVSTTTDGKRIHNAVYRPDTQEPVPVFVNFSPYWGDSAMAEGDNFAKYLIHEYVPRGFAVVLSAVRGTGHSEGCFQIAGDVELQDAYDVVYHFAAEPWSNGRIASGGKSYDSTTQNGLVAKMDPDVLRGIFHVSGITDMYRYNYREGVPYANGLQFTPRYFLTQGIDEYAGATNGAGSAQDEDPESLARIVDDAACPEFPEHVASGEGSAASGLKDAYWIERDWNRFLPDSTWNGSVFFVHGLQDWNVKPDHILPWLETLQAKGNPTLAWLHQETENFGHLYPMRSDWNETMLAWLDWTLKGKDNGFQDRLGFEVQGSDGTWRRTAAWPSGVSHVEEVASGSGDPPEFQLLGGLNRTVRISGSPWLEVTATSVSADPVIDLAVRGPDGAWINEAVRRGNLADGLDAPDPWPAGTTRTLNLTLYPMDFILEEGGALKASANTNGDGPTGLVTAPLQTDSRVVMIESVRFGWQELPIEAGMDQPTPTSCWAC